MSEAPTTSYGVPHISRIEGPGAVSASTYGGEQVVIRGSNFGPPNSSIEYFEEVSYGPGLRYSASGCSVVDHDTITCLTVPGIGSGLPWAVFVASQRSSEVVTTSYGQPTIFSDADQSSWLTPGGFEVFVNGSNIGAGVIGLDFGIELNGLANDLIVLPLTGLVGGGVVNKNRDPSEKVVQAPDSLKFTMVAGRGQGLTYRLVIRDLLSETTLRSNPITFGYAAPQIGNLVNSIQNDLSALACPVYDPIEHRNVEVSENRDVFVLSLRGFNFGPPRADGKGPLVSAGTTRVTPALFATGLARSIRVYVMAIITLSSSRVLCLLCRSCRALESPQRTRMWWCEPG